MNNNFENNKTGNNNLPNKMIQNNQKFAKQTTKILNKNTINKENNKNKPNNIIKTQNVEKLSKNSDWISLGDMHGDIQKFINDLKQINYIQTTQNTSIETKNNQSLDKILQSIKLKNTSPKLIFTGDIMADRKSNGLDIMYILNKLQNSSNCDISIIAGNHDGFLISFLLGVKNHNLYINENYLNKLLKIGQAKGLLELIKYQPSLNSSKNKVIRIKDLNRKEIIQNMQNNNQGKLILKSISNMKLIEHYNDTLFLHTPITDSIIGILNNRSSQPDTNITKVINSINTNFQNYLKYSLLGDKNIKHSKESFEMYFNIFLHTNNQTPKDRKTLGMDSNLKQLQKNQGVQNIVHGHTQNGGQIDGSHPKGSKNPVKLICNDYKYGSKLPSCIGGNKKNIYVPIDKT